MKSTPNLIVMLTHNDSTVLNAFEIFDRCKDSKAKYWGFKEKPLSHEKMKELCLYMKSCGKTTVLEVVEYTEAESLEGARLACDCGFDILMGTKYFDSVNELCRNKGISYMPFVGEVSERPSVLEGEVSDMLREAENCLKKGALGIDLLGYRYTGNAYALIEEFIKKVNAPVCVAGSVDGFTRLDEIKALSPWAFTIGSAFFEKKFGDAFSAQIDRVIDYMEAQNA